VPTALTLCPHRMLPLVYNPTYVVPWPEGHRFPMPKFGLLFQHLTALGLATPDSVHTPGPADRATLTLGHTADYVHRFTAGALTAQEMRTIGLPWSRALVRRSEVAVGGTLLTARLALAHGLASNCAGGTHHAFPGHGSGFCIYNDMALAALQLVRDEAIRRALILDLDVHQGDGTAAVLRHEDRIATVSLHGQANYPFTKQQSDFDLGLPDGVQDDAYLALLFDGVEAAADHGLPADRLTPSVTPGGPIDRLAAPGERFQGLRVLLERLQPDLVIYDAGADPHARDPLGRLALSDDGLFRRDLGVIATIRGMGIPVATVIGGGYSKDHHEIARRHSIVHQAAAAHLEAERRDVSRGPPRSGILASAKGAGA